MKREITKIYETRAGLTKLVDRISELDRMSVVMDLMAMRGYHLSPYMEEMFNTLYNVGVFKFEDVLEITLTFPDITVEELQSYGMLDRNNRYLLSGRYVIPIRDVSGQVTALVGWYPDVKKYITTPTYGFMRDAQFFNAECYRDTMQGNFPKETEEVENGLVYLVEGIFDTISLKALELPALGNMGLEMSRVKTEILTRYKKVIWIPDNDRAGMSVNKYFKSITPRSKHKFIWDIKNTNVYCGLPEGIKDCDDFIHKYEGETLTELKRIQVANYKTKVG